MASSSTEYLPQALSFLIANFQSFITVKLDSSNYFAWKTQIENALTANSLFDYANGSIEVPSPETQDTSGNKIPNPAYAKWETIDRMLMSCIIATVTPPILPHIVGSRRTCEVWSKLEEKYSSLSRTHVHDLRCRIYSLKKTSSMEQYLDSIKVLIQRLEASLFFKIKTTKPCMSLSNSSATEHTMHNHITFGRNDKGFQFDPSQRAVCVKCFFLETETNRIEIVYVYE